MSGRPPSLYLVCYDICGDGAPKRWRRVYRAMRAHGEHLQYSVFRCSLSPIQLEQLLDTLEQVIDSDTDQVMFIPLGQSSAPRSWRAFTIGQSIDDPERVVRII